MASVKWKEEKSDIWIVRYYIMLILEEIRFLNKEIHNTVQRALYDAIDTHSPIL